MAAFGAYIFYNESIEPVSILGFVLITISAVLILQKKAT